MTPTALAQTADELASNARADDRRAEAKAETDADADDQLIVIEPKSAWKVISWSELWRYRELLFFLVWRDVKVRYKQSLLGAAWAVIQPLATMAAFSLFLGPVLASRSGASDVPYPLYVFAGLLPWTFFAGAIASASQSIVGNQNLVTKVYFPRLLIPLGAVGAAIVDFLIAFALLLAMMAYYGIAPSWTILAAPAVILVLATGAVGIGALLAALTVAYRDFRHVVPFMIQFWMFATPVIYLRVSDLGPRAQAILPLNPAYGLIGNFRAAMLGQPFDGRSLAISSAVALSFVLIGGLYFRRVERSFADII